MRDHIVEVFIWIGFCKSQAFLPVSCKPTSTPKEVSWRKRSGYECYGWFVQISGNLNAI